MSLINYIQETRSELKHVSWPSRRQAIAFTIIVIVISIITAIVLGVFDVLLARGIAFLAR